MTAKSRRLFGTDGIRGRANEHPMTPEVALQLGRAIAHVFRGHHPHPRVVIGKDTRLSNYMFETAFQAGVCSMGVDAVQLGVLPTPGIAFMTTGMRADAGVVISASHNGFEDNGIKFFAADGFKLPDEVEARIESLITGDGMRGLRAYGSQIGKAYRVQDAAGRYCVYLKSTFPKHLSLNGVNVVVDCAHGASYRVAPDVLYELGADVTAVGATPDGTNINAGVGATSPEHLSAAVLEAGADVGIALDGDADRVIMCDEKGQVVDGDKIIAMLAQRLQSEGTLAESTVVTTVMSNLGLEHALDRLGIRLERTGVGDRYVVERMRAGGFNLGGEQSGHIILLDQTTTGDGLLCALQVLALMQTSGQPLSELSGIMSTVPQVLRGVHLREKPPLESLPDVMAAIADAESALGSRGRVLVRYSGTENKCRVMLEGESTGQIDALATEICDVIQRVIGEDGSS